MYGGRREGMARAEAEGLVKEALALAMSRDGSSGGVARLVTIHSSGADKTLVLPQVPPPPPPPPRGGGGRGGNQPPC